MAEAGDGPSIATSGRVLGVDLGEVRTGLSLSDLGQVIASAHLTLDGGPFSEAGWAGRIDEVARAEGAVGVVVGLPRSLQGRDGPAAQRARRIAALLVSRGWAVAMMDERFTTTEAERVMIEAGTRRGKRRAAIDRVAAAVILQAWLDGRRQQAGR